MGSLFIRPMWTNGDFDYEGETDKDGKPHGNGLMVFSNGKKFEGEFRNGLIDNGIYREKDNSIIARGEFSGGLMRGWGRYRLDNESVNGYGPGFRDYRGEWENGQKHGKGVLKISYGPGGSSSITEGEFQHGIPCGICTTTVTSPDGDVFIYEGKHGEVLKSQDGWTLLEGNITHISSNEKLIYMNLKLHEDETHYTGHLERENGIHMGHFSCPELVKFGWGLLLEDGVLTKGNWDDGELTKGTYSASVLVEDYTERADKIIQLQKKKPVQYSIELKRILADIHFIMDHQLMHWPDPDLPDKEIQIYEESIFEEFRLMRDRILELTSIIPSKEKITPSKKKRSRTIPKSVRREVWRRDDGKCTLCGSNEDIEYDHIIPHAKGGSNTERNIQLLCESCNRKKSDKIG